MHIYPIRPGYPILVLQRYSQLEYFGKVFEANSIIGKDGITETRTCATEQQRTGIIGLHRETAEMTPDGRCSGTGCRHAKHKAALVNLDSATDKIATGTAEPDAV